MTNEKYPFTRNMEQLEAYQRDADEQNAAFKATLCEDDQAKIEAVEEARRLLTKAGVPFMGFFEIKHANCGKDKEVAAQYNNWAELFAEKETEKDPNKMKVAISHKKFSRAITSYLNGWIIATGQQKVHPCDWFTTWYNAFNSVED